MYSAADTSKLEYEEVNSSLIFWKIVNIIINLARKIPFQCTYNIGRLEVVKFFSFDQKFNQKSHFHY